MYVDGVAMYRTFIDEAPDGPVREGLIDTLMLIYDRRIEYFGGEGNVLGRKGRDLLNYRRSDIGQVQEAYGMLRKSVQLEETESQEAVMVLLISAGITLNKENKIDDNQVIDDYFMLVGILDQLEGRSSRWERTRANIDEMMLQEDILSCDALDRYFEPLFEQNRSEKTFLEKVIKYYTVTGCNRSDISVDASENLYRIDPGPESAHNLAIMFIARNDFQKAAGYLKEAVIGEGIDDDTRADWYYELAIVSSANKDFCDAISYAREAIANRNNFGKAYIALGDAIAASRQNLGDDFQQRTAFWLAADKYRKAASVDPSVADESSQKLADYTALFPHPEDIFFHDLKEGDTFRVGGCANENTTVQVADSGN
jgi:tetratricopeptide (TPR) repeat protein